MSAAASAGSCGEAARLPDVAAAMRQARADLEAAAETARAEQDPLAPVLAGLSSSLGTLAAVQARMEATQHPLDANARTEIVRGLIAACRADFVRAAGLQARRTALLAGLAGTVLLLGALGGGYLWGRSAEVAEVREAAGVIRIALSDGSASARAWADAIRRNDLVALLARCEGRAVWLDAVSGRRACAVPLWLEDAPPPPVPAGRR